MFRRDLLFKFQSIGKHIMQTAAPNDYRHIATAIAHHNAIQELDKFRQLICDAPMTPEETKMFFATLWAFFKDVPSGILSLAAKITDELLDTQTWQASAQAAYILYASVDEYGLQQCQNRMLTTHHQMFEELITHCGLSHDDIFNPKYVKPSGTAMGDRTYRYYRSNKIGEALGFHLASEMTSAREFQYFLQGFQAHPAAYNLKHADDPILAFFKIHCEVEPLHVQTSRTILTKMMSHTPNIAEDAMRGAMAFMNGFEQMFIAMNTTLLEGRS